MGDRWGGEPSKSDLERILVDGGWRELRARDVFAAQVRGWFVGTLVRILTFGLARIP